MAPPSKIVHLATPTATYPIHIGRNLLPTLHPRLKKLAPGRRPFLITSPNIWALWSEKVLASFPAGTEERQSPTVLFHPPGEKHKRLAAVQSLADQLARHGADRDALLIAFGGGVIGDITGFLAAIYMRGVPYLQLPTTLLAQVDSSVGGKTGVNLAAGKNLIGSFHHPQAVLVDIDLLQTLPPRELRAGLQESIKAGIIRSPQLFTLLEKSVPRSSESHPDEWVRHPDPQTTKPSVPHSSESHPDEWVLDPTLLTRIITASIQVKADVVHQDERESNLRMILNFGHTLGHAIEAATNYRKLLHGEAVAWGSIAALHLALARRAITPELFARMANLILAYGPLPPFRATAAQLVALTATDKKTRSGRRAFVLPTGIGSVEILYDVTGAELLQAAESMLNDMRRTTGPSA